MDGGEQKELKLVKGDDLVTASRGETPKLHSFFYFRGQAKLNSSHLNSTQEERKFEAKPQNLDGGARSKKRKPYNKKSLKSVQNNTQNKIENYFKPFNGPGSNQFQGENVHRFRRSSSLAF